MTIAADIMPTEFRRDGSFVDAKLEADFRSRVWKRDCQHLRAITVPVALAVLAPIFIDGSTLGWSSTAFYIDLAIRSAAATLCLMTFLAFRSPSEDSRLFLFPFATTLSANAVILYAAASGANSVAIVTPCAIAATLAYWTFVPLRTHQLLIAGSSLCIGYLAVLIIWLPSETQTIVIGPVLLLMINAMGFSYVQTRNISERKELLVGQELITTSQTLQKEMEIRIAAEAQAGASEEMFRGVFVSSPVPLCLIDFPTQTLLRANIRMTALLGLEDDRLPGVPVRDFFPNEDVFKDVALDLTEEHAILQKEIHVKSADGSLKWVLLSARRFMMPDREAVLASLIDITDQKERATDLANANAEAQKANIAKSQFLANMSHELRTPLNAIIGFSDIMESEVFGSIENQRYIGYISDIKASGIHLLSIINEILDLSKIESGKEDLYQEDIDVNEIVHIAARLVRHHVQEKSILLELELASSELILLADERSIKQIILNLLSNAIKFTPDGGSIKISTDRIAGHLVVQISDSGIGIPDDELHTVTEPFVQLQSTLTNTNAGTGLGLSIATRLAELHGGRIEIESTLDVGTTVRLILPHLQDENLVTSDVLIET